MRSKVYCGNRFVIITYLSYNYTNRIKEEYEAVRAVVAMRKREKRDEARRAQAALDGQVATPTDGDANAGAASTSVDDGAASSLQGHTGSARSAVGPRTFQGGDDDNSSCDTESDDVLETVPVPETVLPPSSTSSSFIATEAPASPPSSPSLSLTSQSTLAPLTTVPVRPSTIYCEWTAKLADDCQDEDDEAVQGLIDAEDCPVFDSDDDEATQLADNIQAAEEIYSIDDTTDDQTRDGEGDKMIIQNDEVEEEEKEEVEEKVFTGETSENLPELIDQKSADSPISSTSPSSSSFVAKTNLKAQWARSSPINFVSTRGGFDSAHVSFDDELVDGQEDLGKPVHLSQSRDAQAKTAGGGESGSSTTDGRQRVHYDYRTGSILSSSQRSRLPSGGGRKKTTLPNSRSNRHSQPLEMALGNKKTRISQPTQESFGTVRK